jgi:Pectinacetylesterase
MPPIRSHAFVALVVAAGVAPAAAQPLSNLVCPNGGPTFVPFSLQRFHVGDSGTPMVRVTLSGPSSRNNDGTPAIMYVRPPAANYNGSALMAADYRPERWLIQFQGGGGCHDAESCYQRWCGLTGIDRAAAMSSTNSYLAIPGTQGIWNRNPAVNDFAGYNQVWIQYRSSDQFIGSASHTALPTSGGQTYDIEFNGEAIANDALERLFDPVGVAPDANPFWSDRLPSLLTAEEVVLLGDSAGSGKLRHALDSLAAELRLRVLGDVRVVGVLDAGNGPGFWNSNPAITWGAAGAPTSYANLLDLHYRPTVRDFWGAEDSALDASCLDPAFAAAHVADGGTHPEVCYDTSYTLFNHITTPFFVRQDIDDPLAKDNYADWQMFASEADYWVAQRNFMAGLIGFAGGLEPVAVTPGVFVPHCGEHVSVNSNHFFTRAVRFPGPVAGPSFHGLLSNWMAGMAPFAQIQQDGIAGPAYTPSVCPP